MMVIRCSIDTFDLGPAGEPTGIQTKLIIEVITHAARVGRLTHPNALLVSQRPDIHKVFEFIDDLLVRRIQ